LIGFIDIWNIVRVKTLDNNDYSIKFGKIQEYKKVLTYKKMYEDLIESFQYIITDLLNYSKKNRIDLAHREHIYGNIEKARELIEYRIEKTSYNVISCALWPKCLILSI
jgi:hypothetical protein